MNFHFCDRCRVLSGAILAGFMVVSSGGMSAANVASEVVGEIGPLQHKVPACTISNGKAPIKNKHCETGHPASPE